MHFLQFSVEGTQLPQLGAKEYNKNVEEAEQEIGLIARFFGQKN